MTTGSKTVDWGGVTLIVDKIQLATKPHFANSTLSQPAPGVTNITADATKTLTESDSGKMIYLNKASGTIITLPTAKVGLAYEFIVGTSVTSNNYKIITASGTEFLKGMVISVDTDSSNVLAYDQTADGSTHRAITMNGTTTGGLIYTRIKVWAVSTTLWAIEGRNYGNGSVATPFATS